MIRIWCSKIWFSNQKLKQIVYILSLVSCSYCDSVNMPWKFNSPYVIDTGDSLSVKSKKRWYSISISFHMWVAICMGCRKQRFTSRDHKHEINQLGKIKSLTPTTYSITCLLCQNEDSSFDGTQLVIQRKEQKYLEFLLVCVCRDIRLALSYML